MVPKGQPEKKRNGSSARPGGRARVKSGVRVPVPVPVPTLIRDDAGVWAQGRVRARVRIQVRKTQLSTRHCLQLNTGWCARLTDLCLHVWRNSHTCLIPDPILVPKWHPGSLDGARVGIPDLGKWRTPKKLDYN